MGDECNPRFSVSGCRCSEHLGGLGVVSSIDVDAPVLMLVPLVQCGIGHSRPYLLVLWKNDRLLSSTLTKMRHAHRSEEGRVFIEGERLY